MHDTHLDMRGLCLLEEGKGKLFSHAQNDLTPYPNLSNAWHYLNLNVTAYEQAREHCWDNN